jgi:glycopeptide antibiotics resistance protein
MRCATIRVTNAMPAPANYRDPKIRAPCWSNRILLLSIVGVLFLTLFPFRISLHPHNLPKSSPFFLGGGFKPTSTLDFVLNVLLFVPFGFGISSKFRQRNCPWPLTFFSTALVGAVFSYLIELAQLYIPLRDSGWEDVFSNATGAMLGVVAFAAIGKVTFRTLSRGEKRVESCLTPKRLWLYNDRRVSRIGIPIRCSWSEVTVSPTAGGKGN